MPLDSVCTCTCLHVCALYSVCMCTCLHVCALYSVCMCTCLYMCALYSVCMCTYLHVCAFYSVCMCTCLHVCECGRRLPHLSPLRQGLSFVVCHCLTSSSLASKPPVKLTSLPPPLYRHTPPSLPLCGAWRSELRSSHLHGKCFPQ